MKEAGLNHKKASALKQALNSTGHLPKPTALASVSSAPSGKTCPVNRGSQAPWRTRPLNPSNSGRGIRTKATIEIQVARDPHIAYRGQVRPGIDRDSEKERLAQLMQYQGDVPQVKPRQVKPRQALNTKTKRYCPVSANTFDEAGQGGGRAALLHARFAELAREVEENQTFLQEMAKSGQNQKYIGQVNALIAEKRREMLQIDAKLEQLTSE